MKSISKKINTHKYNIPKTKSNIMGGGNKLAEAKADPAKADPDQGPAKADPAKAEAPANDKANGQETYNTKISHAELNRRDKINEDDLPTVKNVIIDMHDKGDLKGFIDKIISQFGLYITIILMLLMAPSMPIIFYLTILYNVIILTWENFKALDVDNIEG